MKRAGRTCTDQQREMLTSKTADTPSPLYISLVAGVACEWRSSQPLHDMRLPITIPECISMLFGQLKAEHGEVFVGWSLGMLGLG